MVSHDGLTAFELHRFDLAIVDIKTSHLLLEANLPAQLNDLLAHFFNNTYQPKGANVGFRDISNFFRSSSLDEFMNDFTTVKLRILDLTV